MYVVALPRRALENTATCNPEKRLHPHPTTFTPKTLATFTGFAPERGTYNTTVWWYSFVSLYASPLLLHHRFAVL